MFNIKNKWIVISGGCGYLGKHISRFLLSEGANLIVLGTSQEKFDNTFDYDLKLNFIETDLKNESNLFNKISVITDKIDCLINNSYYCPGGNPKSMSNSDWMSGIDGTVGIYYRCIRDLLPMMDKNSSIINMSSMYGVVTPDFSIYDSVEDVNPINYGVGKAGVIHMTKYFSNFLAKDGIRVNCISPGAFPSDNTQKNKSFISKLKRLTSMGRVGKPEDLYGVVSLLCSDASSYITGQNIIVDGGFTNSKGGSY